jgi:hypothetical protein
VFSGVEVRLPVRADCRIEERLDAIQKKRQIRGRQTKEKEYPMVTKKDNLDRAKTVSALVP